jgi:hypothetical protein
VTAHYVAASEGALKAGDLVLGNCLLINGGAAIAILAFMGNVLTKDPSTRKLLAEVSSGLNDFAIGVVAAMIAMGLTYVDHLEARHLAKESMDPPLHRAGGLRIALGLAQEHDARDYCALDGGVCRDVRLGTARPRACG